MTQTQTQAVSDPVDVDPSVLKGWLDAGEVVLIDVREPFEHAAERIEGGVSVPLSTLDPKALREKYPGKKLVFHCAGGKRSAAACKRFAEACCEPTSHLAGGIAAWKSANLPTIVPKKAVLPLMQQVQITAGSLVVIGLLLGWLVTPGFYLLSGFVGCGLVFAGITGWCGMAKVLGAMPWNRV